MGISTVGQKPNHTRSLWKMDQRTPYAPASQNQAPPESTRAEAFYYIKQKDSKTPMVVSLLDGEEVLGVIEWYDENYLKIRHLDGSEIIIMKHGIKYLYKQNQ
jgi:hypothetical protein